MGPDIKHGFLDTLFIRGYPRGHDSFFLWELPQKLCPEMAQVAFGGDFVAKIFRHVYFNDFRQCLQHAFMPGCALVQKENLKKLVVLQGKQILRLQIIVFMAENKIRVEDQGMKGALFLVLCMNTVHDILVNDEPLTRLDQVRVVIGRDNGDPLVDNQNFHFFMPVPANPVQVRFTQIQVAGVDRVIQCAVVLFGVEAVIGFRRDLSGSFCVSGVFRYRVMQRIHRFSSYVHRWGNLP